MTFNELNKILKIFISFKEQKVSLKLSYKLAKSIKKLEEEKIFYDNQYIKYINEYAQKDEKQNFIINEKNAIKIQEGKEQECIQKVQELEEMEVEIPTIEFTLGELEELQLTIGEMEALLPFIKEEN